MIQPVIARPRNGKFAKTAPWAAAAVAGVIVIAYCVGAATGPSASSSKERLTLPSAPAAATGYAAAIADFNAAAGAFAAATAACDSMPFKLSAQDGASAYEQLQARRAVCEKAMEHAEDRPFGNALPDPIRSRLNKAIHDCGLAYAGKYTAFDDLMKALDGGGRPSQMAEAKQWVATATIQGQACDEEYSAALVASGLDGAGPSNRS